MIGAVRRVPTHGTAGSRRHRHQCAAGFVAQFVQSVESSQPHDEAESDDRAPGRLAVPPVAMRSSTISTRSPGRMADVSISTFSVPYSRSYSSAMVSGGSLPALRIAMNPLPSMAARAGPNRNPLASSPATASNESSVTGRLAWSAFMRMRSPLPSASTGMKSRNLMPSLGNPGMVRIFETRYAASPAPTSASLSMVMSDCVMVSRSPVTSRRLRSARNRRTALRSRRIPAPCPPVPEPGRRLRRSARRPPLRRHG